MRRLFADSFFWIALTNPQDALYEVAQQHRSFLTSGRLYTTEEVLVEFLAFFATDSWLRVRAAETVRLILSHGAVRVLPQTHESFISGLELYEARPNKGYSVTDCISMQCMRQIGLTDVLTNDRHFEHGGFTIVFRAVP